MACYGGLWGIPTGHTKSTDHPSIMFMLYSWGSLTEVTNPPPLALGSSFGVCPGVRDAFLGIS